MVSLLALGLVLQYNLMAPRAAERDAAGRRGRRAGLRRRHRVGRLEEQAGARIRDIIRSWRPVPGLKTGAPPRRSRGSVTAGHDCLGRPRFDYYPRLPTDAVRHARGRRGGGRPPRRSGPGRPCRSRWRRTTRRRSNSPASNSTTASAQASPTAGSCARRPSRAPSSPSSSQGADLIACAETGTGKTAAFLLPIMQRLLASPSVGTVRVLVLAPTRELAVQIEDDFTGFAYHTALTGIAVYGGVDGDMQFRALRAGADVVVATPGRLLDHMNTGLVDFSKVEVLVLDEADRMLDMGFWPDVRKIVSALPAARQTLLFSATTSSDVVTLAEQVMRDPRFIQIGRAGGPATTIAHIAHVMPAREKVEWLTRFLRRTQRPVADLRPHQARRGPAGVEPGGARRPVRGAARRPHAEGAHGRGRGIPVGPPHGARRHRHRRPRPRHRRHRARHQLRRAAQRRHLRAPRRAARAAPRRRARPSRWSRPTNCRRCTP